MQTTALELIKESDPGKFIDLAKQALPERQIVSAQSLETLAEEAEVYMDMLRTEAVVKMFKDLKKVNEEETKIIKEASGEIKRAAEQIKNFGDEVVLGMTDYSLAGQPGDDKRFVFLTQLDVPLLDKLQFTLEFVTELSSSLFSQAKAFGDDGEFYPNNVEDVSAYVRRKQLIQPISFDSAIETDYGVFTEFNTLSRFNPRWVIQSEISFQLQDKDPEDERALVLTQSEWENASVFLRQPEVHQLLADQAEYLDNYLQTHLNYLDTAIETAKDITDPSDLENLVRVVDGLHENWKNIHCSLANFAQFVSCYSRTAAWCANQLELASK